MMKINSNIYVFIGQKKLWNINYLKIEFLNPEEYHEIYAEALMVDIQDIRSVYEVCSIPDIDKETLKEKIPHEFAVFKNNSLPLDQN
jgi:phenylacetate-coenzyme A ligase PaaK-like adenylate-forming protein